MERMGGKRVGTRCFVLWNALPTFREFLGGGTGLNPGEVNLLLLEDMFAKVSDGFGDLQYQMRQNGLF